MKLNILHLIKDSAKMKISTIKSATNHTRYRYLQGEVRETAEHKLKILKRELIHIIGNLTNWKDFVFSDPLMPFGTNREKPTLYCTHLQITYANSQTKPCKRVQSHILILHDNG